MRLKFPVWYTRREKEIISLSLLIHNMIKKSLFIRFKEFHWYLINWNLICVFNNYTIMWKICYMYINYLYLIIISSRYLI